MVYIMISGPAIWGKMQPIDETVNSYSRSAPSLHNWTSLATQYGLRWDKCDVLTSVLIHRSVELTAQSSKGFEGVGCPVSCYQPLSLCLPPPTSVAGCAKVPSYS